MPLFAPPDLFAALAIAAERDEDLARATHVRLLPSPVLGFPLAPVGLYRIRPEVVEPGVVWYDRRGQTRPDGNLDAAGGVLFAALTPPAGFDAENLPVDVAVEVDGFDGLAVLLDAVKVAGSEREFSRVSQPPYVLGAPRVNRLRLEGRGVARLRTWRVHPAHAMEQIVGRKPVELLSLPIKGQHAWYSGGLGRGWARDRVLRGAPQRLTPADRPDGPLDALTREHEAQRIEPHAAGIIEACERMVDDPAHWPFEIALENEAMPPGRVERHSVEMRIQNLLLMEAMDPGLARFLGLMGCVEDVPQPGEPVAYAAVGIYAMQRFFRAVFTRTPWDLLGEPHPYLDRIVERHIEAVEAETGERGAIRSLAGEIAHRPSAAVRGVLAICGAVPPPDRPLLAAPSVSATHARWIGHPTRPSNSFRQEMIWSTMPLGGLMALGRLEAEGWKTRQREAPLAEGSDSPPRVLPLLMGRTREHAPAVPKGLLSDAPILSDPAGPPSVTRYRAAMADLFGRFGPPAEFDVTAPPRPAPPSPAPQAELVLDGATGSEPGAVSPGRARVSLPVPNIADLPAGSLPIARVRVSLDGAPAVEIPLLHEELADAASPRTVPSVSTELVLPALGVAQKGTSVVSATFEDTAGGSSLPATVNVSYADRRPPVVIPSGLGLIWTSRPGPAAEVEMKLTWPAEPGSRYRVFVADAAGLGIAAGPRAHQAVDVGQRARNQTLGARDRFRLLGEIHENGGRGVVNERLPRSLSTVQVVRIVPLTQQGKEATFEACPVVPVAVPTDRRSPSPRLSARIDEATGRAVLWIEAEGFDGTALQAAEPGLFTEPADPEARAPEFRIRRATGPVPDPLYAREVARGTLRIERTGTTWRAVAEVEDPGELPLFVRAAWWAEVRPPAERRMRAGFAEVPPAAGVAPMSESQRQDLAYLFSLPSAPAAAMRTPPVPAAPVDGVASLVEDGANRRLMLQLPAPPAAHAKAVAPYRLRVWEQWGTKPIESAGGDILLAGADVEWQGPNRPAGDGALPAALLLAYVDPLGRQGAIARLDVA